MRVLIRKCRSLVKLVISHWRNSLVYVHQKSRDVAVPIKIRRRIKSGILAIDIRNHHGLGSKLTWTLELLAFCEENDLQLHIRYSYPHLTQDYFALFFDLSERISSKPSKPLKYTIIRTLGEVGFKESYDKKLTLESAAQLVNAHLVVKSWVTDAVNEYCKEYFSGTVLGLHYRGTDKTGEAEFLDYDRVCDNIMLYSKKFGTPDKLFVSTDSVKFLNFITTKDLPFEILYRANEKRSGNEVAVHFGIASAMEVKRLNEEALINCLLLARCSFLLKSSSFLSDWSKLFNPEIKVTVLNKPYDWALWFPGRALIEQNEFTPI